MRTYTKTDLKREIGLLAEQEERKIYKKDIDFVVDNLFELIEEHVKDNDKVVVNGFGKFSLTDVKSFMGRDPRTEEEVNVESYKRVIFKTGADFKRKVNGDDIDA